VLSLAAADGFKTLRTLGLLSGTNETEQFCWIFDKFFDIWNTRYLEEGVRKKKDPNLEAFRYDDDERLKVLSFF